MKKNLFIGICTFVLMALPVFATSNIFENKVDTSSIDIPAFKNVSCKFEQIKQFNNNSIKSGGDFRFLLKKGVIFETLYPVKYTTSYSSKENKYVNDIILSISKKNFSSIEKHFDIYYLKNATNWILGLKPKQDDTVSEQLNHILIFGEKDINKIIINTINSGSTEISFSQCKEEL